MEDMNKYKWFNPRAQEFSGDDRTWLDLRE